MGGGNGKEGVRGELKGGGVWRAISKTRTALPTMINK